MSSLVSVGVQIALFMYAHSQQTSCVAAHMSRQQAPVLFLVFLFSVSKKRSRRKVNDSGIWGENYSILVFIYLLY